MSKTPILSSDYITKDATASYRINSNLETQFKNKCKALGFTKSDIMRQLIISFLKDNSQTDIFNNTVIENACSNKARK